MSMFSSTDLPRHDSIDELQSATSDTRAAAIETVAAIGSAMTGESQSLLAQKIHLAHSVMGFVRKHPVPAVCLAVAACIFLGTRRRANGRLARH